MANKFDYIVIGAGPGGTEAALTIIHQGQSVALIEADKWGGTCLFQGCIPTKALLHASKDPLVGDLQGLFAKIFGQINAISTNLRANLTRWGVTLIQGVATFVDANRISVNREIYEAKHLIFAGGSSPISLNIPGIDFPNIYNSETIYSLTEVPSRLAIIGGGYIGFEWANIFSNFGSQVTIYEALPQVLSAFDDDIRRRLLTSWRTRSVRIETSSRVKAFHQDGPAVIVETDQMETYDAVLIAIGRRPSDAVVPPGVVKIGDANGAPLLAHKASAEGKAIFTGDFSQVIIPAAMFTDPEIATVGASEQSLKQQARSYKTCKLPYRANSKAYVTGVEEGFIKLMTDEDGHYLLGAAIIGYEASDIINVLTLAIQEKIPIAKLKRLVFPHPTIGEVIAQALDLI